MRHLQSYRIFEDERFSDKDMTNYYHCANGWVRYTKHHKDTYIEIKDRFGISADELGWILTEFLDEYDLLYSCRIADYGAYPVIIIDFFPNLEEYLNEVLYWMERKIGHGQVWDWEMLSEMNNRLGDYDLTIKDDGIYQIFLTGSQLQLIIKQEIKSPVK